MSHVMYTVSRLDVSVSRKKFKQQHAGGRNLIHYTFPPRRRRRRHGGRDGKEEVHVPTPDVMQPRVWGSMDGASAFNNRLNTPDERSH